MSSLFGEEFDSALSSFSKVCLHTYWPASSYAFIKVGHRVKPANHHHVSVKACWVSLPWHRVLSETKEKFPVWFLIPHPLRIDKGFTWRACDSHDAPSVPKNTQAG